MTSPDINDKGTPHFPTDCDDVSITSSAKDVFKGEVLIDRLLVYYGKFEGSRQRAVRYAQKLLDLGHIESLTNGNSFEDSAHVYRWTDVAQVLNKARSRGNLPETPVARRRSRERKSGNGEQDGGKSILKISIETDNCQGAEIQARIRASPRNGGEVQGRKITLEPNIIAAVEEDSFFGRRITKTLSYVNEPGTQDAKKHPTPFIIDVSSPDAKLHEKCGLSKEKVENEKPSENGEVLKTNGDFEANETSSSSSDNAIAFSSPRKPLRSPLVATREVKNSHLSRKSATEPVIAKGRTPGADVDCDKESETIAHYERTTYSPSTSQSPLMNHSKKEQECNSQILEEERAATTNQEKPQVEINEINNKETHVASTQTSEKSILRASNIFNGDERREKRTPSPAPRSSKRSDKISHDKEECGSDKTKSTELGRINEKIQQKKTRFSSEISNVESESAVELNGDNVREDVYENCKREMTLHSSGYSEDATENGVAEFEDDVTLPPLSPPPPSPTLPQTPSTPQQKSSMKSLFWTKIPNYQRRNRKVFWDEVIDDVTTFDHEEFEKLFSKPPLSPQTPRVKGGRVSEGGRTLKVLSLERSRQVGIRANSVRLPMEEIHDAIVNMDDDKMDLDALQALYDVRPTAEELDDVADVLKSRPNGILDKPEQFILMIAMIPSLDERLQCWIFAKKFPDKMVEVQEQILAITEACNQIMQSTTLRKVLEIVLLLGNRMNKGTQRGDAYGFYLDILPKLKDVKSQNGETTLLQYTVKMLRNQMKSEGKLDDQLLTPRANEILGLPDHDIISRSIAVSLSDLGDELESTAIELEESKKMLPSIVRSSVTPAESETFQHKLEEFLNKATEKMRVQAQLYQDSLLTLEDFQKYYLPDSHANAKESVTSMLQSVSTFCTDFRNQWIEVQRDEAKEEFYKIQRHRMERQASIQVRNTPSALKERFMARRTRNVTSSENKPKTPEQKTWSAKSRALSSDGNNKPADRSSAPIPKRSYRFEVSPGRKCATPLNGHVPRSDSTANGQQRADFAERASENSIRIEKRMRELHSKRNIYKSETR